MTTSKNIHAAIIRGGHLNLQLLAVPSMRDQVRYSLAFVELHQRTCCGLHQRVITTLRDLGQTEPMLHVAGQNLYATLHLPYPSQNFGLITSTRLLRKWLKVEATR